MNDKWVFEEEAKKFNDEHLESFKEEIEKRNEEYAKEVSSKGFNSITEYETYVTDRLIRRLLYISIGLVVIAVGLYFI